MNDTELHEDFELNEEVKNLFDEIKKVGEEQGDEMMKEIEERLGFSLYEFESALYDALNKKPIIYKKLHPDAVEPSYAYETDSGFDLLSIEEVNFGPFERKLVPTGLSFNIPEGFEIQIRTKSGLALKQGLMVLNSPGTIDQGYTGEIKVILMNMNNTSLTVNKGQKIAQGVICAVESGKKIYFEETSEIEEKDRNDNGFGSTGI